MLDNPGTEQSIETVFKCMDEKMWALNSRIKRVREVTDLKRKPNEHIMNFNTRVKLKRETAKYENLTKDQSRVLYVILN